MQKGGKPGEAPVGSTERLQRIYSSVAVAGEVEVAPGRREPGESGVQSRRTTRRLSGVC